MSCVWRPIDVEEECGTSAATQKKNQDKNEGLKIKVGEQERAIVLEAYERNKNRRVYVDCRFLVSFKWRLMVNTRLVFFLARLGLLEIFLGETGTS